MQQQHAPQIQQAGNLTPVPGGMGPFDVTQVNVSDMDLTSANFEIMPQWDTKQLIDEFNGNPIGTYEMAVQRGMAFDAFCNLIAPPSFGDYMHPFKRIALQNGFMLESNPRAGYFANETGDFMGTQQVPNVRGRVILKTFLSAIHREVVNYEPARLRQQFAPSETIRSDQQIPGSYDLPWHDSMMPRYSQMLEMQIPLALLTSRTENIRGADYREIEIELNRGERSKPVEQGTDFPVREVKLRDQYVRLHKRGIAVKVNDEARRRCRIDRLAEEFMISMINDKIAMVYEACAVVYNGDENDGTEAVKYDPYALDADGDFENTGKPTFHMWRNWKGEIKFESPYRLDLIFGDMQQNTEMVTLPAPESDPVHLSQDYAMNPNIDRFEPMPMDANTIYYIDVDTDLIENMTGDQLVAMNRMFGGITLLYEIGGTYTEQERNALNQSDLIVSSMVYGMGKRQKGKCASYVSYDADDYPATNSDGSESDYADSPWNN